MADHLRNPNKRRQHENSHAPEPKDRKLNRDEVDTTDAEAFTNICNELIERIFEFLDPQN